MTKSELVERIATKKLDLSLTQIEESIRLILEKMVAALTKKRRIEIRGFGSFKMRKRAERLGRNPKTGESVELAERYVPHFKPGKELKEKINANFLDEK